MTRMMEQMLGGEQMFSERSSEVEWWRENMRPEYTTPAALWLIHPDCGVTGRTYESRCGRVARVVVAETRGFMKPGHTVEDVRDHFQQVEDASVWYEPEQSADIAGWERRWLTELSESAAAPAHAD